MYKKILCVSVLALGLNGVALAEDADSFSGSDYSSDPISTDSGTGIYFGGQVGMSNMHYGSKYSISTSKSPDNTKLAFRGFLGYAFSQFIAAELGYDYYGQPTFKSFDGNKQTILEHGMDLVAKASLPLNYGFSFYIKGGLAWIHRSALTPNANQFADKPANSTFTPVGGLGVNYWFVPNMAIDLAWTKTMTVSDLPTTDLFTIGLVYRINI